MALLYIALVLFPGVLLRTGLSFSFPLASPSSYHKRFEQMCRRKCRTKSGTHIYIFYFSFFFKNTLPKNTIKFCAFVQTPIFLNLLH